MKTLGPILLDTEQVGPTLGLGLRIVPRSLTLASSQHGHRLRTIRLALAKYVNDSHSRKICVKKLN